MPGAWNLFAIGRRRGKEDQLTEMLAWLIEAVPEVGRAILGLALPDLEPDGAVDVVTQPGIAKGRLDALFTGRDYALIVESKIDSDFHDDQIPRYLDWLAATYGHKLHRGLMTLTVRPIGKAQQHELLSRPGVVGSAHLWEELHDLLDSATTSTQVDPLSRRLIDEFLEMLGEEGLIPMKPIELDKLQEWRDACETVEHFHGFFAACRDAFGKALGAQPDSHSQPNPSYVWQDFRFDESAGDLAASRVLVGIQATDEERAGRSFARRAPLVFLAANISHLPESTEAADRLRESVPDGWTYWDRMWGDCPRIGRYFDEVVQGATFEEQRDSFASAVSVAANWLRSALPIGSQSG